MKSAKRIRKDKLRERLKKQEEKVPSGRAKVIAYDDTEQIMHYHKTNRKSGYLTQKMRDLRDRNK